MARSKRLERQGAQVANEPLTPDCTFSPAVLSARFNPSDSTVLYAVVNSSPAAGRAGRGKKVERRAFLVRYQLVVPAAAEAKKTEDPVSPAGTWAVKKVRNIGKRAVTVFTVRYVYLISQPSVHVHAIQFPSLSHLALLAIAKMESWQLMELRTARFVLWIREHLP